MLTNDLLVELMFIYMSPTRESSDIYYSIHDIFELYTTRLLALGIKYYFHLLCLHIMGKNCCRHHDFMLLVTYPRWLPQNSRWCSYNFCINALNKIFPRGVPLPSLHFIKVMPLCHTHPGAHMLSHFVTFFIHGGAISFIIHALFMSWSIMSNNQLERADDSLLLWRLM